MPFDDCSSISIGPLEYQNDDDCSGVSWDEDLSRQLENSLANITTNTRDDDNEDGDDHNHDAPTITSSIGCGSTTNGRRTPASHRQMLMRLPAASASRQEVNELVLALLRENEEKDQELISLKIQLAKQKEKFDALSNKLSKCQVDHEIYKAAAAATNMAQQQQQNATASSSVHSSVTAPPRRRIERRFSLSGISSSLNRGSGGGGLSSSFTSKNSNNGSMQMLIDSNGKLMEENKRLEVSVAGLRRSYQSYIKLSVQSESTDKDVIDLLQQEVASLRTQLNLPPTAVVGVPSSLLEKKNQSMIRQSYTTQPSSSVDTYTIDEHKEDEQYHHDYTTSQQDGDEITEDDLYNDVEENEDEKKSTRDFCKSESELLVDFNNTKRQVKRRSSMSSAPLKWQSQIRHPLFDGKHDLL